MVNNVGQFTDIAEYSLLLHTPYEKPVSSLSRLVTNFEYHGTFLGTDEVTFDVPYLIYDYELEEKVVNPVYEDVRGDYLVLISNLFFTDQEGKFFIIEDIEEETDADGNLYKSCQLYTREYELNNKHIIGYEGLSRLIYDKRNEYDNNGLEIGLLNFIENRTSWTVDYISSEYLNKHRAISISNSTMLQAIQNAGETFDCVFRFDTVKKTISVLNVNELGSNNDAYISDKNIITDLKKETLNSEVKTRLYLFGNNNISIQKLNPLGQPYIDDFSFFMNTDYMTQDLIDALKNYEVYFESQRPNFEVYNNNIDLINEKISDVNERLFIEETRLKELQDIYDLSLRFEDRYPTAKQDMDNQQSKVDVILEEKDGYLNQLKEESDKIEVMRSEMRRENHFTPDQIYQLDSFIKEDTYRNTDYEEEQIDELYEYGKKLLKRKSSPTIDFEIDVIDFLSLLNYQGEWRKFRLGDVMRVVNEELNFDYLVRLVGYEHVPEEFELTLLFSNKDNLGDKSLYALDVLDNLNASAISVDWNKYKWDYAENNKTRLERYIEGNLDLSKQQLVTAEGQESILNDRGFWLRKTDEIGRVDPAQIRMVNNVIAMTKDDWETVDIALSPEYGINANLISGKIVNGVEINGNLIRVGDEFDKSELGKSIDGKIEPISNRIDGLDNEFVKQNYSYNYVMITPQKGLEVFDADGRQRVQLGNWAPGRYGLKLTDASGRKTVLDDRGILQSWQDGRADNTDTNYPLKLRLRLPEETAEVYNVELRIYREKYRAYSKGMDSAGYTSSSTSSGGSNSDTVTSTAGGSNKDTVTSTAGGSNKDTVTSTHEGGQTINKTTGVDSYIRDSTGGHNHGLKKLPAAWRNDSFTDNDYHGAFEESGNHDHSVIFSISSHSHKVTVDIPNHTHKVTTTTPNHTHSVPISIPNHTHKFEIDAHSHPVTFGIYEESNVARNIRIYINGSNRTAAISGKSYINSDETSLDITNYINKNSWNTIEIHTNGRARIDATVFVQALLNYGGY